VVHRVKREKGEDEIMGEYFLRFSECHISSLRTVRQALSTGR
jgi:hypothetical protein